MKELGNIVGFGQKSQMNIRVFNIVLSATLAILAAPGWASLFFAVCAWVAWSDRPKD